MTIFPAYARDFRPYPERGLAFRELAPLLQRLERVDFSFEITNPDANQGQLTSDFDQALERAIASLGSTPIDLKLGAEIPQRYDFAFAFNGRSVAVGIEKTNREKILRDVLKCHMYLNSGASFCLVVLPRNYPHKLGVWDLYSFGVQQLKACISYGFGIPDKLERILLLGFETREASTGELHSVRSRQAMRLHRSGPVTQA
jgi:hypothetical protein